VAYLAGLLASKLRKLSKAETHHAALEDLQALHENIISPSAGD